MHDSEQHALTDLFGALIWRNAFTIMHHWFTSICTAAASFTDRRAGWVRKFTCSVTTLTFREHLAFNVTYCMGKGCKVVHLVSNRAPAYIHRIDRLVSQWHYMWNNYLTGACSWKYRTCTTNMGFQKHTMQICSECTLTKFCQVRTIFWSNALSFMHHHTIWTATAWYTDQRADWIWEQTGSFTSFAPGECLTFNRTDCIIQKMKVL